MNHIRKRLSPLAMPQEIEFVDSLPKTRSGIFVRRILRCKEFHEPVGCSFHHHGRRNRGSLWTKLTQVVRDYIVREYLGRRGRPNDYRDNAPDFRWHCRFVFHGISASLSGEIIN